MRTLIKRKVLYIEVQLVSPLSVSSGEDEWTDSDVLRDSEGQPFVTGSSLAGAMRAYLGQKKNEDGMMGYSGKDKNQNDIGKMSSLFISDLIFDEDTVSSVRDGVALDKNKTAMSGSKFDIEVIEARAKAHFYMELTVREGDNEARMNQELANVFTGINAGEIRIGSKKTRGFGRFKILSVKNKEYGKENYQEYAHAYEDELWKTEKNQLDNWLKQAGWNAQMIHIEVPLRMEGGISIRQYVARKGEPDYIHLTDHHDNPVIPGSSFAGAIRHRIQDILEDIQSDQITLPKNIADIMDTAFGYVNKTEACASNIIISESEIKNAHALTMVRTGISRFESSAKRGALYKEKTYVDGELTLEIAVRKSQNPRDSRWIMGLLLLALKDLQNGFLAVGGQTAIGRGIFTEKGPLLIDGEASKEDQYIVEMLQNMSGMGGNEL